TTAVRPNTYISNRVQPASLVVTSGYMNASRLLAVSLTLMALSSLPVHGQATNGPTWDGVGLWNLNNVNNSTLTFPSNTIARFTNFQYAWPPAVSIVSKQNWTVESRLVLLERVRAWNFTNISGGDAWETTLQWGSGSAAMAYGRDDTHSPSTGVQVGGQCFLGTLTMSSLIGQWITSNITLYGPTQPMYFSVY